MLRKYAFVKHIKPLESTMLKIYLSWKQGQFVLLLQPPNVPEDY